MAALYSALFCVVSSILNLHPPLGCEQGSSRSITVFQNSSGPILPLFGLVGIFHYGGWLPSLGNSDGTSPVDEGVRKFGKWLRKRGWVQEDVEDISIVNSGTSVSGEKTLQGQGSAAELTAKDNQGMRLILEFATAYAITKALLPVRIVWSVWATPWFARTVVGPFGRAVGHVTSAYKRK
ncbi:hypothetical protein McanCB56680_004259 [Microsporum canis]